MGKLRAPLDFEKDINRALHDLSTWRPFTTHTGLLIPFYTRQMFAGDEFKFDTQINLRTAPFISPNFSCYRVRVEYYFEPLRNLYGWMDNNTKLTTQEILDRQKNRHRFAWLQPQNVVDTLSDVYVGIDSVKRGSLAQFMGMPAGYSGSGNVVRFSGDRGFVTVDSQYYPIDKWLTYLDIVRCYHTNTQEGIVPYICDGRTTDGQVVVPIDMSLKNMDLRTLDNLFVQMRSTSNGVDWSDIIYQQYANGNTAGMQATLKLLTDWLNDSYNTPYGGLFCSMYEPDLYRNLLSSTVGNVKSKIRIASDNSVSIDEVRFANKFQALIDDLDISGGRFSNTLRTVWGVKSRKGLDIPELIHVSSQYIGTNIVTSTADTSSSSDETNLGQMGGNIRNNSGYRKGKFYASEPGYIMGIFSIVPVVSYSQNLERDLLHLKFTDDFTPEMSQLGYQNVPISDYDALPSYTDGQLTTDWGNNQTPLTRSVGRQVAWLNEMTDVNRAYGEFSEGGFLEHWVMNRKYRQVIQEDADTFSTRTKITSYVNPLEWQYMFSGTDILTPNFYVDIAVDNRAKRPIGRRYMPTLGR